MGLFYKWGETVVETGRDVTEKAKKTMEIMNLKSQIETCEERMNKNYMEIGKMYYELYGEHPDEPFEKACRNIKYAQNGVEKLQEKIAGLL